MRIYYYAYSSDRPGGGQKQTYRHVDVLNQAGYDAVVLHETPGYRLKWFANLTPVVDGKQFAAEFRPDRDLLVLPEPLGMRILQFPGRKIIFNKNIYLGFKALPVLETRFSSPYQDPSVVGAFVVSAHNQRQLLYAYPDLPVWNVGIGIDSKVFSRMPLNEKRARIACVAKCPAQLSTICGLLRLRLSSGSREDSSIVWLENMTEQQVATTLRDSLALLTLSFEEGMPQTIIEAALSGCVVAAPAVGPLKEWKGHLLELDPGEPCNCAETLYGLITSHPHHRREVVESVERNYREALRYSHEAERAAILAAWGGVLRQAGISSPWAAPCPLDSGTNRLYIQRSHR